MANVMENDVMSTKRRAFGSEFDEFDLKVEADDASTLVAAGIWARATALRDELRQPATAEEKLDGIKEALAESGAQLIVARQADHAPGFSLLVPRSHVLEVLYLAVDPRAWGFGIAARLLDDLRERARVRGVLLELWVIAENARAIAAYERAGWVATGEAKIRNDSGRLEKRYVLVDSRGSTSD